MRAVRWLHLSDLHIGCEGRELWWQTQHDFRDSLREQVAKRGRPDLIILTGDLTWSGQAAEYQQLNAFLGALRGWIDEVAPGPPPFLLPVPGNHDVARPKGLKAHGYKGLAAYDDGDDSDFIRDLNASLWGPAPDASFIADLFPHYLAWFETSVTADLRERAPAFGGSHFPGDYAVRLEIPGATPIRIVGLNSAWLQYTGGDFYGNLAIAREQFFAALPRDGTANPLRFFDAEVPTLLLQHHPPSWFSEGARRIFEEEIYRPDRFAACLHGHLHEGRTGFHAGSGGDRYFFQAPSLFGLDWYRRRGETRFLGYAFGEIDQRRHLTVWPFEHAVLDGRSRFVPWRHVSNAVAGVRLRPWHGLVSVAGAVVPADFSAHLRTVEREQGLVIIGGLSSGAGRSRKALKPIEIGRLYTPLRTESGAGSIGLKRDVDFDDGEPGALTKEHTFSDRVGVGTLTNIVGAQQRSTRGRDGFRLLIEGQPGAGKTTFLRYVAFSLARSRLGAEADGAADLGFAPGESAPVPVFVRLAQLAEKLDGNAPAGSRHRALLKHLAPDDSGPDIPSREAWEHLFAQGDAWLLFDGLDEVADPARREALLGLVEDAMAAWPRCPILVASRPVDTDRLRAAGFDFAVVAPFGDAEIKEFLRRWTGLLFDDADVPEARTYAKELGDAILTHPQVRRLATNPVMLTALVVIHWNEGKLPNARSRVYAAIFRWLLAARTDARRGAGFTDDFSERCFACLALAMMAGPRGKRSVVETEEVRMVLLPLFERQFSEPQVDVSDRRRLVQRWLDFESTRSGLLEEIASKQYRFWHLTFQEYLAARELAWRDDSENAITGYWGIVKEHVEDPQWRETLLLLPGCLRDDGGPRRVDEFLRRICAWFGFDPENVAQELRTAAKVAGCLGGILEVLSAFEHILESRLQVGYARALERSMAIFTMAGAAQVSFTDRLAAADALGRAGDPRLTPEQSLANLLEVPKTGGVCIGRFPVTVTEYLRFIEDGGYDDPRWWSKARAWQLRVDASWTFPVGWSSQLERPNGPVTGLSWYEAMAYCSWMSTLWQRRVFLPDAALWRAAACPDRRKYPWGSDEPDASRANFENNVKRVTPVGLYPKGVGKWGHLDMAGNVWEWGDPLERAGRSVGITTASIRGGAFDFSARDLLANQRFTISCRDRGGYLGFRVAAAPANQ